MKLKNLRITNFRNIDSVQFNNLDERLVFWGDNGQGKTNLLEAIWVLLVGKSFRAKQDMDLIKDGCDTSVVSGLVGLDSGINHQVKVQIERVEGKTIYLDDKKITIGGLLDKFLVNLFSPDEVDLIRSSTVKRRRLLDELLMRVDLEYKKLLADFVKVWRHRNQLLLAIKQGRAEESELDVWDTQMAELGIQIIKKRDRFIKEWGVVVADKYKIFGEKKGTSLKLTYIPNIKVNSVWEYKDVLLQSRRIDIIRTHTTKGIHRDDLGIVMDGQDAVDRASRGEFRSIVLSLKVAEIELLEPTLNEKAIFLLDDVWSELDDSRREALEKVTKNHQVVVTTHELQEEGWKVESGNLKETLSVL
ncbi:MAG: DNA replication and repair protein RecF [Patescibacteria group bacterium]